MTEEEFIRAYCVWCDIEDYDEVQWGKDCYAFERCFARWGTKNEIINQ